MADAATADPNAEDDLLHTAQHDSLGALKNKARRTKAAADRDPEATRRRIHARRSCRHWTDSDGVGHLHATGPSDVIGRMAARIAHQASKAFDQARRDGRREPLSTPTPSTP